MQNRSAIFSNRVIKLSFSALTAHLFFLCNLHLADHCIVQHIDDLGRGTVSDFVVQSAGADAVAQHRVRAVRHITCATKPGSSALIASLSYSLSGSLTSFTFCPAAKGLLPKWNFNPVIVINAFIGNLLSFA